MKASRRARGFTLIELVVTATIVSVLALSALPLAENAVRRAKESELRIALRDMRGAIDAYKRATDERRIARTLDATGYPPTLEALVEGVRDEKDPKGRKIYFLRRIPRDPFNEDASVAAARSWGRRSYASPPEAPAEGADVFDVYSNSPSTGLRGAAYREW